ncbi:MAG: RNA-binding transcriptional accessory protein [Myxococcales bacterium]|nr:RNA-binding transcriptional accessory protein [Myxococcales bacterium]
MTTAYAHAHIIATELSVALDQVERTVALLADGATIPFIARYRKEVTGNLDEVQIASIDERRTYLTELDARKQTVLAEIVKQGKLTDGLRDKIARTLSKTELEDLYLPYKPKRRTRATIARERGLEPLAEKILKQGVEAEAREALGTPFVDPAKEVADVEAAFAGARDIVAESVAERAEVRAALREQALESGTLAGAAVAGKEEEGSKFKDYFNFNEPAKSIPSHRLLALRRGEAEGFLRVLLEVDGDAAKDIVRHKVVVAPKATLAKDLDLALADAYDRLLKTSIEVDVRLVLKERADAEAIRVFAGNLRALLLQAPLGGKRVLAIDPGFRTGCKVAVIDAKGDLQTDDVVYPTQSERKVEEAAATLEKLCKQYRIESIAIGNGTAGRETETFVRKLAGEGRLGTVKIVMVNESGASIYSASEIAREELPDQDITVRGAVSIGRRLQDPLAELVKIDPKSIGVGQYQHDVHQPTLKKALDQVVESCVNAVGVDVNTASVRLLQYVAGVGETLAKNIVAHRAQKGAFAARKSLLEVPRLGQKAFEQAAGFLRVRSAANPLDNSAVHPESYDVVERMAKDLGVDVQGLVGRTDMVSKIDVAKYVDERRGLPTLKDILGELIKPGRDPRAEFEEVGFDPSVTEFDHVRDGMVLQGVVTNVTQFGAFIDVGVHQDGLVHVSEIAHRFVKDPAEVLKVGDRVKVKVVKVDVERRRIGLSIKQATLPNAAGEKGSQPSAVSSQPRNRTEQRNAPQSRGLEGPQQRGPQHKGPDPRGPQPKGPAPKAPTGPFSTPFNNPFAAAFTKKS